MTGIYDLKSSESNPLGLKRWSQRMGVAALVAQAYPEARRALIAQGRPAAVVEAMPTIQVAALYTYQSYQEYRDDVYKWAGLPQYQAFQGLQEAWNNHRADLQRRPLLKLFTVMLGSIQGGCMAEARVERQLNAIQCIEAIRIYAAIHHRFPARLEEIREAPSPSTRRQGSRSATGSRATRHAVRPLCARCPACRGLCDPLRIEDGSVKSHGSLTRVFREKTAV